MLAIYCSVNRTSGPKKKMGHFRSYTEPYSVIYLDTLSHILRVPQSYSEIPPLQKVFWEGYGVVGKCMGQKNNT